MKRDFTIIEQDESGNVVASYGQTIAEAAATKKETSTLAQRLIAVFLPAGFPASVTDDYVGYQIYDSLQAFSSSIASLLTSRAVLEGFGVGDANASATSAMLLTILQDCVGRIATILFAYKLGPALEAECKMYRFMADIFNDSAMILDCLSPKLPQTARIAILCLSGSLRALCGVAGGASKASLSVHFARTGNVGELNAKDSSQETVISLLGMLAGSFVVSHISSGFSTWIVLIFLLGTHLATNYKAVRCVAMNTMNRQRTNILFTELISCPPGPISILSPKEVAKREHVLEKDGLLRFGSGEVGFAEIGVPFSTVIKAMEEDASASGKSQSEDAKIGRIRDLVEIFEDKNHILYPVLRSSEVYRLPTIYISLKTGATSRDQIKAWTHALLVACSFTNDRMSRLSLQISKCRHGEVMKRVKESCTMFDSLFTQTIDWKLFQEKGWDLDTAHIETRSGYRISLVSKEEPEKMVPESGSTTPASIVIENVASETAYLEIKKVV
ncbi:vitamin B6 photo-protection and homoeostasis-domain-containing protein [Pyronema omphalodes]|nr:vitamin B6 photo-protection and homoeostasis-domain-containing protein [Pyronema omphalodes]